MQSPSKAIIGTLLILIMSHVALAQSGTVQWDDDPAPPNDIVITDDLDPLNAPEFSGDWEIPIESEVVPDQPEIEVETPPAAGPFSESLQPIEPILDGSVGSPEQITNEPPPAEAPVIDLAEWETRLGAVEGKLEEQLQQLELDRAEIENKAAPKKSFPTGKWTGRIHLDYWAFPNESDGIGFFENPNTGFDPENRLVFRRVRLGLQGDINDSMLYKIDWEFNNPAVGEYKDVYIGWKNLPHNQQLLIGHQKRPLGLDHLNSSNYNTFRERPMVIETFNSINRRIGAAVYGHTDDEVYHWRYGIYTLEDTTRDGRHIGDTFQPSINGRISSSPWYDDATDGRGYFHWALAGMYAWPDGDGGNETSENEGRFRTRAENRSTTNWFDTGRIADIDNYSIVAVETMLNFGRFHLVGEFQTAHAERLTGNNLFFYGGYVSISWFLTGEHIPLNRKRGVIGRIMPFNDFTPASSRGSRATGMGAWQIAARYSFLDISDDDITGGVGDTVTAALNWYWSSRSRMQFDYTYGDIADRTEVGGFTGGTYGSLGVRFSMDF